MSQSIWDVIDSIADDLKPDVQAIESSVKTTKDHYGRYLSILTTFKDKGDNFVLIVANSLIKAGANKAGVTSALGVLGINIPEAI